MPVAMDLLDLRIGQIPAFIFAVLATVYIASATRAIEEKETQQRTKREESAGLKETS